MTTSTKNGLLRRDLHLASQHFSRLALAEFPELQSLLVYLSHDFLPAMSGRSRKKVVVFVFHLKNSFPFSLNAKCGELSRVTLLFTALFAYAMTPLQEKVA